MFSKKLAAVAAISMITASSAAVAQSVAPASAPMARAGVSTEGSSELDRRGAGIYIIGAIVLGLLIWGAIELLDDGDSESP